MTSVSPLLFSISRALLNAITISGSSGLSKEDVEKLVKEAAANEAADKGKRELIEERNKLDNLVYQTDKALRENRDKMPADHVSTVESALTEAKSALDSDDVGRLKAAFEKLTQASYKLAEAMYQGGAQPGAGPGAAPGGAAGGGGAKKGGDDVIDADFEEA